MLQLIVLKNKWMRFLFNQELKRLRWRCNEKTKYHSYYIAWEKVRRKGIIKKEVGSFKATNCRDSSLFAVECREAKNDFWRALYLRDRGILCARTSPPWVLSRSGFSLRQLSCSSWQKRFAFGTERKRVSLRSIVRRRDHCYCACSRGPLSLSNAKFPFASQPQSTRATRDKLIIQSLLSYFVIYVRAYSIYNTPNDKLSLSMSQKVICVANVPTTRKLFFTFKIIFWNCVF